MENRFGQRLVEERLTRTSKHDAQDAVLGHVRERRHHGLFRDPRLLGTVEHVVDATKGAFVIAVPDRTDLDIDRKDLLRLLPIVLGGQPCGGALWMKRHLVPVDLESILRTHGSSIRAVSRTRRKSRCGSACQGFQPTISCNDCQ